MLHSHVAGSDIRGREVSSLSPRPAPFGVCAELQIIHGFEQRSVRSQDTTSKRFIVAENACDGGEALSSLELAARRPLPSRPCCARDGRCAKVGTLALLGVICHWTRHWSPTSATRARRTGAVSIVYEEDGKICLATAVDDNAATGTDLVLMSSSRGQRAAGG